ncbi:hypothetical protein NCS57_00797100 [Fusarium keratoplasticum]|uniref:Uncharacterized protein n=1 Tax=Fusarium keratoplasticum TaxID=1328300 RepID=A0ACC0QYH1_9HYPO|nr:hypothetical protein NCS57_00797100 [Fusarium keratoplasticum]KAI8669809.1 hypothetical protein NCS57_00797100 [Fusarium keratoplasticum]
MATASFDYEQRKLCQSLIPPASQPDTVSLLKKKALSALGKSGDTAICIPSDVESDTEDEDNKSRELNILQSYVIRASTPDYLDLTGTKHGITKPEAATGAETATAVSPAQAEAGLAWPNETQVSRLAEPESSQQSYEINHMLTGDMSACQDVNFATPPASPNSQPYPVAADRQQLRPAPASQQGNMMVDAIFDHDACHSSQGHPDSPSTCIHSPRAAGPVEAVQASLWESEIPAGNSCDDAIPKAYTPSPARPSLEPHQGQGLDDASSASSHIESEVTEGGSGFAAEVSSTSPSLRRFRHKSLQVHKTMQPKDGDADSEAPRSEDGLNGLESQHQKENSPPLPYDEDSGSEDDDFDDVH